MQKPPDQTTDPRVAEVFRAVRQIFQRAGYVPADPEVGRILRSMLRAHELMRAKGERGAKTT